MAKFLTRKNPWYTATLMITFGLLGALAFYRGDAFCTAWFYIVCGANLVWLTSANPPDIF